MAPANSLTALDTPFLLLPFRPTSDPSAARTFVRHFFTRALAGDALAQELRLTEPMVRVSDFLLEYIYICVCIYENTKIRENIWETHKQG